MSVLAKFRPYRPVKINQLATNVQGTINVVIRPTGSTGAVNATYVRGAQTQIGTFSSTDPFGAEQLSLSFPAITIFDTLGHGELEWLVHSADVDVSYDGDLPAGYPTNGWRWEGYIVSFGRSNTGGLEVNCIGALRQMDNYLAKPTYPTRPLPYEYAIIHAWDGKPDARTTRPVVEWPTDWSTIYRQPAALTPGYLIPAGVQPGNRWSGLVTRATGSFDPLLTSYISSLLAAMYTPAGRFTLDLDPHRRTVLRMRPFVDDVNPDVIVVNPGNPGVAINVNIDWSQSLNVVYGQGTALNGVTYSGMQVSADGNTTTYTPLAALRQVEPTTDKNGWLQQHRMRKEVNLELTKGLDQIQAQQVAQAHLQQFADPGVTGTITLTSDPRIGDFDGPVCPRLLIRAGMTVWVPWLFGNPDGQFFHISSVSGDIGSGTMTLTVDSKYRDTLTVNEVKLRTRDSLSITRALISGQYKPLVPDDLLPWSYAEGSGYIPSGHEYSSLRLFAGMPNDVAFPWESWLRTRPPRSASWKNCYIPVGTASPDADNNWAVVKDTAGANMAIPVKMSQAGNIRLIQLAAYDGDGNVMPVAFHVSFYYLNGTNVMSMPKIVDGQVPTGSTYQVGQHYPFFRDAFQTYKPDGTLNGPADVPQTTTSAVPVAGASWGDFYERAGYYPGSYSQGDPATGMFVDETGFSFDVSDVGANYFDPRRAKQIASYAGYLYIMIYCDGQGTKPVYFTGRLFRAEPGTGQ